MYSSTFVLTTWRCWSTTADLPHFLYPHLCVAHALRLRHLVGEVRLLKARGTHALVHRGVSAWWRVRRVEACLDQSFARFTCDHGLEFAGGKSVDVARFTGHEQQDLGSRQGGQFICLGKREKKIQVSDREGGPKVRLEFKHQKRLSNQSNLDQ